MGLASQCENHSHTQSTDRLRMLLLKKFFLLILLKTGKIGHCLHINNAVLSGECGMGLLQQRGNKSQMSMVP